jgi:hypothetical protein
MLNLVVRKQNARLYKRLISGTFAYARWKLSHISDHSEGISLDDWPNSFLYDPILITRLIKRCYTRTPSVALWQTWLCVKFRRLLPIDRRPRIHRDVGLVTDTYVATNDKQARFKTARHLRPAAVPAPNEQFLCLPSSAVDDAILAASSSSTAAVRSVLQHVLEGRSVT